MVRLCLLAVLWFALAGGVRADWSIVVGDGSGDVCQNQEFVAVHITRGSSANAFLFSWDAPTYIEMPADPYLPPGDAGDTVIMYIKVKVSNPGNAVAISVQQHAGATLATTTFTMGADAENCFTDSSGGGGGGGTTSGGGVEGPCGSGGADCACDRGISSGDNPFVAIAKVVFVPCPASLQMLMDRKNVLLAWGPFGFIADFIFAFSDQSGTDANQGIAIPVPVVDGSGHWAPGPSSVPLTFGSIVTTPGFATLRTLEGLAVWAVFVGGFIRYLRPRLHF